MINTIFYFPASLTFEEYLLMFNNGNIADRTIVFADALKAIYKGGKKYCELNAQELYNTLDSEYDDSWLDTEIKKIKLDVLDAKGRVDNLNDIIGGVNSRLDDDLSQLNKIKGVVEWLYSGLKSNTDQNNSFSEIYSAGSSAISRAISDVRTYVEKLKNGEFVAQGEVDAKVNDAIASLITQASGDSALAALSAKVDANSDDIAALLLGMTNDSSTADIQTRIRSLLSGFASTTDIETAKSEIYSAISATDGNDDFISLAALKTAVDANTASIAAIATNGEDTSGLVTRAGLGEAVAELFASSGNGQSADAKASVVALVRDNKSLLQLSALDVDIDGYLSAGNATFKGDIIANSFITGDNQQSGISVMTGQFDSSIANTNKAYFAYDNEQGAVTMWFYKDNTWKRIDLNSTQVLSAEEGFIDHTVYNLDVNSMELPVNPTPIHIYESRISGKCYTTASSSGQLATGTYYKIKRYRTSVDNFYRATAIDKGDDPYTPTRYAGGISHDAPSSGVCIIPRISGQAQAYGSYSAIPQNGRWASETLIAADVTKFVVNSSGYIVEDTGTHTATAYYMVENIDENALYATTSAGTTGFDIDHIDIENFAPYGIADPDTYDDMVVSAVFVKPMNLTRVVLVACLNGFIANASTSSLTGTSAFVPCTLNTALTYIPGIPADGGKIAVTSVADVHAGCIGYVKYIDDGPNFEQANDFML